MPSQFLKQMDWMDENESVMKGEGRHGLHIFGEESSGENIIPVLERSAGKSGNGGEMTKEKKTHGIWVLTLM